MTPKSPVSPMLPILKRGETLLAFALATVSILLAHATPARAGSGGGVGNGGGAWTCRQNTGEGALIWVQLVDLSEARREFNQAVPFTGNVSLPIPSPHDWLVAGSPYLKSAEAKIQQANPQFYAEYLRRKADLLANRILVPADSDFDHTSDILHHTRPDNSTCPNGHILQEPEQLANFTTMGNLEINPKLWGDPTLSEIDRAALFVHEVVYWIFRDFAQDTDSLRTRVIVGYLFSASTPVSQYASMITLMPTPAGTPAGLPLLYGLFAEITGRWVDIEVRSYNTATHELQLVQKDRDNHWAVKSISTFRCSAHGSEYQCFMTGSTRGKPSEWTDRYLRIVDPTDFVWVKLRKDGTVDHATHYSKVQ